MAILRYDGPMEVRELWGVSFPYGEQVETNDTALIEKALKLDGFSRVDAGPLPVPAAPPADDYETVTETEVTFPAIGAGLVPEGWASMHWKQKVKLARELTGKECTNAAEAEAALKEAMEPR